MKNIIIGTAGHIDHGKTALIKALTGTNTDRLQEEKKRGITIELGFAYFLLDTGERAGIVDVPGHEKFIKNMLAGAGGMDMVLLVVAADDGVMPQTREHLGILRLLSIQAGIVVITKCDLVEQDWLELVREDVKKAVEGTFLEKAPIVCVSSHTGEGLPELKQEINRLAAAVRNKDTDKPLRMPVDRVFTIDGFGTVVTGTVMEGTAAEGDEVEIYPSGLKSRIRNLQVHAACVPRAYAGQRVAINLGGLKKEDLDRGDTVARPGSMRNARMLDVRLHVLPDAGRAVKNGSWLHFHHGAREALCKVALLDAQELAPGQSGFAQLRFNEQVAVKAGDHYVVRFYSPLITMGGGVVLDAAPRKHRRNSKKVLEALTVLESGSGEDRLLQVIRDNARDFLSVQQLHKAAGLDKGVFDGQLAALVQQGKAVMAADVPLDTDTLLQLEQRARDVLQQFHAEFPLKAGMKLDEFKNKLVPGRKSALGNALIQRFQAAGIATCQGDSLALAGFEPLDSPRVRELREKLDRRYRAAGFEPPTQEEALAALPGQKEALAVLDAMIDEGTLVVGAPKLYFHREACQTAVNMIQKHMESHPNLTLAEFRDMAGTSRKYALALLDYLDRARITKKVGDARVLVKRG